ncbi:Cleavage stimulation factor 50 kDa subunit [Aphelenchoides besseyi]|nr:Cleavage stimulation factor 50 kDa subunit [Aphelenchoides besseyi]
MKGELKDRDLMYKLIIGQLFYDGHQQLAVNLSQTIGVSMQPPPPSDKLFRLVTVAKQFVEEPEANEEPKFQYENAGLDLEFDADVAPSTPEACMYETVYVTVSTHFNIFTFGFQPHKGACRAAAFNNEGSLFATGSEDSSIKILDVEKIMGRDLNEGPDAHHPVIRTLYDHDVSAVAFHPREQVLLSGSRDLTMKIFDYSKTAVKRAVRTINETASIQTVSFHPSGEYVLVGTTHQTLRLYNVETQQCWVSPQPRDQHSSSIMDVRDECELTFIVFQVHYSESGRLYVTASKDGNVKVWDGVSNRCVETFQRAHDGAEVTSACFTKNSKYILTSGMDSTCKLWELSTNRCLIAYTGAGATGTQEFPIHASFNHNEDYVLFPDEKSGSMCSWDSRTGDRKRLLTLGHTAATRVFVHSPTMSCFVTGSDDHRARFWMRKAVH